MAEYINLLLNLNLLFLSFSLALAYYNINKNKFNFRKRFDSIEKIFSFNKNLKNKKIIYADISFFITTIIFTIIMIVYFMVFYYYIFENYDNRFWYVFRLIISPFVFLIIPSFLPSILENLFYGFFPNEFSMTNKGNTTYYKYRFIFDWIWVFGLLTILTLFVSWESDIVWLSLLILELILLFIIAKIFNKRRMKYSYKPDLK